jgi:hypothetical protein
MNKADTDIMYTSRRWRIFQKSFWLAFLLSFILLETTPRLFSSSSFSLAFSAFRRSMSSKIHAPDLQRKGLGDLEGTFQLL